MEMIGWTCSVLLSYFSFPLFLLCFLGFCVNRNPRSAAVLRSAGMLLLPTSRPVRLRSAVGHGFFDVDGLFELPSALAFCVFEFISFLFLFSVIRFSSFDIHSISASSYHLHPHPEVHAL